MAGGIGSRFWPINSNTKPKQFLDLLGMGQSMLQTTFYRFEQICPRQNIIIVTGESMVDQVRQQIPDLLPYQVLAEPMRRNTAPCIAYAAAIINEINPNANVIVTPSDHAIFGNHRFEQNITDAVAICDRYDWIITMGAQPTNPNTKYGYIQFADDPSLSNARNLHKVVTFTEKPPVEMARKFIASGEFFWNAGIFIWSLPVLMDAYRQFLPDIADSFFKLGADTPRAELSKVYTASEAVSVDVGIMEKASNVHVMEAAFGWSDVETWDSLYNTLPKDAEGNAAASGNVLAYESNNCMVHVPMGTTAVIDGLDSYIVTLANNKLLICPRSHEDYLVKYAADLQLLNDKKNNKR